MPGPLNFDAFLGWVNVTDPNNIPPDARVLSADDLLRYEKLGVDTKAKFKEVDDALSAMDSDTVIAEQLAVPESQTRAAVQGMVDEGVEGFQAIVDAVPGQVDAKLNAEVPTRVTNAIAADSTIQTAATTAVNNKVAGLSLVKSTDPGLPASLTLNQDNYLSAELSPLGKLTRGTRKDGSVEIPVARLAGSVVTNVASDEYVKATVSPSGKVFEDAIGKDGRVPQWILDAWKARMGGLPQAAAVPYDIFVIAGQSNGTQADTLPITVEEADPRLFRWNSTSNVIEPLPASSTYLGADLARNYIKDIPPGRNVLVVDAAVGSTGFSSTSLTGAAVPAGYHGGRPGTWTRTLTADPNNLALTMIARAKAARTAAGAGARVVGWVWSQGEDDRVYGDDGSNPMSETSYAAALDDLIAWTRTELALPSLPVLIGSMVPEQMYDAGPGTFTEGIHKALVDTPRRVFSSTFIFGPENMHKYNEFRIHWSAQGQRERGRMFAEALYRAKLNLANVRPLLPQNLRASRSLNTVRVAWDAPPARVTSYNLQYSTDSGATWVNATLTGPLFTEATLTISESLPVRLRVRAYNIDYAANASSDFTREVNL